MVVQAVEGAGAGAVVVQEEVETGRPELVEKQETDVVVVPEQLMSAATAASAKPAAGGILSEPGTIMM